MRIALVNGTRGWGGGERWFLEAAAALRARGHSVTVSAATGQPLALRASDGGIAVAPAADLDAEVGVLNSRRDLVAVLRAFGDSPPFPLVFRRGIDRPLHGGVFRRRAWRRLAAILANSAATAETVRRSLPWFPAERVRVIPNPVAFTPAPPVTGSGPFRLGLAARLVRQKGIDVLLRALSALPGVRLEVAGGGKLHGRLTRLAAKLGVGTRVAFLGHLDDLAPFYARQDLVAVPSRYEGFCFVAVEAALAGIPVVASRVSSLAEVVLDGVTGVLVPPDEPEALAAAIRALAADPSRRRNLGLRAREEAERRYRPGPIYDTLESFLSEAAGYAPIGGPA